MSVLSYLNKRAADAVLSTDESKSIATSITTLTTRLDSYFTASGDGLSSHFRFGSSTRGTILPRSMDAQSDIDYMIVFEKGGFNPQTYLDRLKRFAEKKYSSSEIYQSSPTLVLELNHIKFDLVPALFDYGTTYKIPKGPQAWQSSNPNDFNQSLEQANKNNNYILKPTIRLAKLWNAQSGYVFDSYDFERWIKDRSYYGCSNQSEYLFSVVDGLPNSMDAQWQKDKVKRAKELVDNVRYYERSDEAVKAEIEMKKLIKE